MRVRLPGLSTQVVVALVLGVLVGWLFPGFGKRLDIVSQSFVRLVLVIIAPLIFSTLVVGISDSGRASEVGHLALRTVILFLVLGVCGLGLGFVAAGLLHPGSGISVAGSAEEAQKILQQVGAREPFVLRLVPASIVEAMSRGDILQIVVFSLLFALALRAGGERGQPVLDFCRSLTAVMFRFTDYVMALAPVGVFGAAAAVVARQGLSLLANFAWLIVAVYSSLAVLLLLIFPAVALLWRIPMRRLMGSAKEAVLITFATASSAAGLPKALEGLEDFGLPKGVAGFVLSTGISMNQCGTSAFVGAAALFVVQAYQIPLAGREMAVLFGTLFIVSRAIPAVPRGSLLIVAAGLGSFGFPPEIIAGGIGLLLGIDPILDMARSATNMAGHCLTAAVVARRASPASALAYRAAGTVGE